MIAPGRVTNQMPASTTSTPRAIRLRRIMATPSILDRLCSL